MHTVASLKKLDNMHAIYSNIFQILINHIAFNTINCSMFIMVSFICNRYQIFIELSNFRIVRLDYK